jgi:hypothetical protein
LSGLGGKETFAASAMGGIGQSFIKNLKYMKETKFNSA